MSPRQAAANFGDRASLHIRELKFTGAGRWLVAAVLVAGGAGGGALGAYGILGGAPQEMVTAQDVVDVAGQIREDMREVQGEQREQGVRLSAALERLARIEAYVEEIRRGKN